MDSVYLVYSFEYIKDFIVDAINGALNIEQTGWLIDGPNRDILYSRRASQRNIL